MHAKCNYRNVIFITFLKFISCRYYVCSGTSRDRTLETFEYEIVLIPVAHNGIKVLYQRGFHISEDRRKSTSEMLHVSSLP
jgi:hypothetical protein